MPSAGTRRAELNGMTRTRCTRAPREAPSTHHMSTMNSSSSEPTRIRCCGGKLNRVHIPVWYIEHKLACLSFYRLVLGLGSAYSTSTEYTSPIGTINVFRRPNSLAKRSISVQYLQRLYAGNQDKNNHSRSTPQYATAPPIKPQKGPISARTHQKHS